MGGVMECWGGRHWKALETIAVFLYTYQCGVNEEVMSDSAVEKTESRRRDSGSDSGEDSKNWRSLLPPKIC
ncbi:unnamed protein product [Medioppia subpectinata]|uniref:Uncharacterized protein n=1 Tax=Medioppia subpectinata TaxID=1979941 RepID=A0A7R9KK20_9ACAR|nr:unnamed protein product [Medioppia subpectinata]CAG2105139.1 unnamed protein product [Medioppia subpectinata]